MRERRELPPTGRETEGEAGWSDLPGGDGDPMYCPPSVLCAVVIPAKPQATHETSQMSIMEQTVKTRCTDVYV